MLELRYNGCPDCLSAMRSTLASMGYLSNRHYRVEFHADHRKDNIYQKRPDYLKIFSGGILYNPKTEEWIDFYSADHTKKIVSDTPESRRVIAELFSR